MRPRLKGDLTVGAVLSGNRNFEGRIHPLVKTNWLVSPPLVVAYALAGNMNINLATDPLGYDRKGDPVYLKDIWPSAQEIARAVELVSSDMFRKEYAEVFEGTEEWKSIQVESSDTYGWQSDSTYIRLSPFFDEMQAQPAPVKRYPRRAYHGDAGRFGDDRPYFPGRQYQAGQSRRTLSAKPRR